MTNNVDYLVNKIPSDFEEKRRKTAFPVSVLLDYEVNSSICGGNKIYIDIGKIKIIFRKHGSCPSKGLLPCLIKKFFINYSRTATFSTILSLLIYRQPPPNAL